MENKTTPIEHELFRDIAERVYRETGVMVTHVSFDWFNSGAGAKEGYCCIMKTSVDSMKSR